MVQKISPAIVAALSLLVVVLVFAVAFAIMLVRGTPVPAWAQALFAPLVTLLVGWVVPSPKVEG